ncbi:MAG: D-aminoacyl-tRNA deacylase [Thermodesulfobacteriota bacterium]
MRAVVQRVNSADVEVGESVVGKINKGLLILLGISRDDNEDDVEYLTGKILKLRVFDDEDGKMNLNVVDSGGSLLVVSQFTLYGDCRKGNRPSYEKAADPDHAKPLYELFINNLENSGIIVEKGLFGANMQVNLINSGPVTLILESKKNNYGK